MWGKTNHGLATNLLRYSLEYLRWHKLLPTTLAGDRLYAHLLCLLYNGHLPRPVGGGYNDFLAYLKGCPEIDSALRRCMTDKEFLKQEVGRLLGPQWCVPTLAVLYNDREIDAYEFPPNCVIKPTHSSGQVIFLDKGTRPDRKKIKKWLRHSHYRKSRERNYRGLQPKIMVEPLMELAADPEYWVYCLRGCPAEVHAYSSRLRQPDGIDRLLASFSPGGNVSGQVYGIKDGQKLPVPQRLDPPANLFQMVQAAARLSQGMVFARVDFLQTTAGLKVGEFTSVSGSGLIDYSTVDEAAFNRQIFGSNGFRLADYPELLPGYRQPPARGSRL